MQNTPSDSQSRYESGGLPSGNSNADIQVRNSNAASESAAEPVGAHSNVNFSTIAEPFHTVSYYEDWRKLFAVQVDFEQLYDVAVRSETTRCGRFRSLFWRAFLDVLPQERAVWPTRLAEQRATYEMMRKELTVSETDLVLSQTGDLVTKSVENGARIALRDDPLSQHSDSRWYKFFSDRDLRAQIEQDVRRCMPEVAFFQDDIVQDRVLNILFLYCRKTNTPYRQGMHELLAPLVFAVHCDGVMFAQARESALLRHSAESRVCPGAACDACALLQDDLLSALFDSRFEEHDCYALFATLMDSVEPWYTVTAYQPVQLHRSASANNFKLPQPFESDSNRKRLDLNGGPPSSNALGTKLTRIHDVLLKRCDAELHSYLNTHGIAVQLYGIRWLRLLFGREFTLADLLIVWDTLFAETNRLGGLDFIDWLFCAMLIYIRSELLNADVSDCLQSLMRYPRVEDVRDVIRLAFHLRDPQRYPRPLLLNEALRLSSIQQGQFGTQNTAASLISFAQSIGSSVATQDSSSLSWPSGSSQPSLPDWTNTLMRGFSKKPSTSQRKGPDTDNWPGDSVTSDNSTVPKRSSVSPKKGSPKANVRELQPIERGDSRVRNTTNSSGIWINQSAATATGITTQNESESDATLVVRRVTLETVFFMIETYVDQVDTAMHALQESVNAPSNRIENHELIDTAFDELRRVQIVLKTTVSECRTHLNDVITHEKPSTSLTPDST